MNISASKKIVENYLNQDITKLLDTGVIFATELSCLAVNILYKDLVIDSKTKEEALHICSDIIGVTFEQARHFVEKKGYRMFRNGFIFQRLKK